MLQGMGDTEHENRTVPENAKDEYEASLLMSMSSVAPDAPCDAAASVYGTDTLPRQDGGSVHIEYKSETFRPSYLDEYTREILPH